MWVSVHMAKTLTCYMLFAGIGNYVVCACIGALTFSIFVILVNTKGIV